GHAERRAMPRAELAGELGVARERQEAAGRDHAVVADEGGAVVQRRVRQEEARQQIGGHEGVEGDAQLRVLPQAGPALDHDDGAALRTRSATRTASTVSATSWARMRAAPPSTAAAVAASEPGSRAAGSSRPVIAPTKDLRETPTHSGRPSAARAGRPASTATSQACQTTPASRKKPMPGSSTIRSSGTPAARAAASAVVRIRVTLATGASRTRPGPGA